MLLHAYPQVRGPGLCVRGFFVALRRFARAPVVILATPNLAVCGGWPQSDLPGGTRRATLSMILIINKR